MEPIRNLNLLLIERIELLIRAHYMDLEIEVTDEEVAKDIVDIIRYAIKFSKGPYELEDHLSIICELLGITRGYAVDREIKKAIIAKLEENVTNVEMLKEILFTLYYRDDYCLTVLNNLRNNPETCTEEIESLCNYFESFHYGQVAQVQYLNELYEEKGLTNDHSQIVQYVLETYDNK